VVTSRPGEGTTIEVVVSRAAIERAARAGAPAGVAGRAGDGTV
jgi:hypothetical protein